MSDVRRFRYALAAGATTAVIGMGFVVVGFDRQAAVPATRTAAEVPPVVADPAGDPGTGADLLLDEALPTGSATPSAPPTSRTPATKAPAAKKPKTTTPAERRTTPPPTTPVRARSAPVTSGSVLDQVLDHINAARAEEDLAPLSLDASLSKASALHNQLMTGSCGLAHQCPGEGGIGARFTAQGVAWSSAGENIGFGFAGDSDAELIRAANGLCDSMLAEVPPADGHRKNLLSKSFKRIGLSVIRESDGRTWLTQDFVG